MNATSQPAAYPLIDRLFTQPGYERLEDAAAFEAFAAGPGTRILFFTEDPVRVRETLDLAVILPEIVRGMAPQAAVGVLMPALANERASTYGVRRWPALVFLRDGGFTGHIEGLREWSAYVTLSRECLGSPVRPLPARVIPLVAPGGHC